MVVYHDSGGGIAVARESLVLVELADKEEEALSAISPIAYRSPLAARLGRPWSLTGPCFFIFTHHCYRAAPYFPHLGFPGFSTTRSQYALDKNTRYKYSSYLI